MKRFILPAIAALFAITSCGDSQDAITPSDIDNLRLEPKEGAITLKWDLPADHNYMYVKVEYTNPRTKEKCLRVASSYTDSLHVGGLLARDGEFIFSVCTVSSTNTPGDEHIIAGTADPVQPVFTAFESLLSFTEEQLSANAPDLGGEGVLANLIDGAANTFFMTAWRSGSLKGVMPHWVQFELPEPIENVRLVFRTRHNANYAEPDNTQILVGTDGVNWENIGGISPGDIPAEAGVDYETDVMSAVEPFTKLRFNVTEAKNGYWGAGEIEIFKVWYDVYDPENQ